MELRGLQNLNMSTAAAISEEHISVTFASDVYDLVIVVGSWEVADGAERQVLSVGGTSEFLVEELF